MDLGGSSIFVPKLKLQLTGVGRISYCLAPLERAKTGWRGFGTGQNTPPSPAFGHAVLLPLKRIQTEKIQPLEISKGKWHAAKPGKVRRVPDLGQQSLQLQAGCGIL